MKYKVSKGRRGLYGAIGYARRIMDNIDRLLLSLHALYNRLHNHKGEKCQDSLLTKYEYFVTHGENGENCTYAKKARSMFVQHDLEEVKKLLRDVMEKLDAL